MDNQISTAVIFAGTFAVVFVLWNLTKGRQTSGKLPPSLTTYPLIGSISSLPGIDKFPSYFLEKSYEIGDVIGFKALNMYCVVLNSHETIREVLKKQSSESADRPEPSSLIKSFNPENKGIIQNNYNDDFKKYRQLTLSILKEFGFGQTFMETRINAEVEDLIQNLQDLRGEPINPKQKVASTAISIIASIVLGDRLKAPGANEQLEKAVDGHFNTTKECFVLEFIDCLKYLPRYKAITQKLWEIQDYIMGLVDKKIEAYRSTDPNVAPPLDSFITSFLSREGEKCDVDQLRYTVRDFLLAGFETSSTSLVWIILTMANHINVQDRIQRELDAVVPSHRMPALEDKIKLPYLEAVILEVMRMYTLAPLGVPHCCTSDIHVNGYTIPKGSRILPNLYAAHMNKNAWQEPEVFKPERFLNETQTQVINKEQMISFSVGKRSCIGEMLARQEIFLFSAGLLQKFKIRPPEGQDHIEFTQVMQLTVQPSPFTVRFLSRD